MTNRAIPKISLVIAILVFAAAGLVVTAAVADIGASSTPLETNGPDLVSAEGGSNATFCFDEPIDEDEIDEDGDGFHLTGYDDDIEIEADDADESDEDSKCVDVDFNDDLPGSDTTVAYVAASTVEDTDGTANPVGTVALGPDRDFGAMGTTAAPDLEDFDVDEAGNDVTYDFDSRLDESSNFSYSASDFGVHDEDGSKFIGDSVTVGSNDVTVQFSEDLDDDTVRAYVDQGAVGSQETDDDDQYLNPFESLGEETDEADLESVERQGGDTFRFYFDEDLDNDVDDGEAKFHVYAEDGEEFDGDEIEIDNKYVDVEFSETEHLEDFELPLAAVEPGAVETDTGGDDNTAGSIGLAESHEASGYTDAPDLIQAEETDGGVHLTFDEEVAIAERAKIYVISAERSSTASTGITIGGSTLTTTTVDVDSSEMDVSISSSALSSAVGVVLSRGAAEDHQGNQSAPTAIGFSTDTVTSIITSLLTTTTATTTSSPTSTPTPTCSTAGAILGSDLSEVLRGTGKADVICSFGGDDYVHGRGGNDTIITGTENDIGIGGGGKDNVNGQAGNDDLRGGGGADELIGSDGNDRLNGQGGRDLCRDASGDNTFRSCERT